MHLLLVNPNTSAATTAAMLDTARSAAGPDVTVSAETVAFGTDLITSEMQLLEAATAIEALLSGWREEPDGVIVSAFGDPGLERARTLLRCPVTGIAEAAMAEAAREGRRFAVATTTPGLKDSIARAAERSGHASAFCGVFLTPGEPGIVMADRDGLEAALVEACRAAIRAGAEAVIIGGGPLAVAARAIASRLPVPIIEPIPAAVRLAVERTRARSGSVRP